MPLHSNSNYLNHPSKLSSLVKFV